MKKASLVELLSSLALLALPFALGLWLADCLPAVLSTRFDFAGQVTGRMDRNLFLVLIPLIMLAAQLLVFYSSLVKPLVNKNFEHLLRWLLPMVNLLLYPAVLYRNLQQDFPMTKLALLFCGLLLVVLGNYLPKKVQADRQPLPLKLAYAVILVGLALFIWGLFL